jgi:hypothetical protein
MRPTSTPAPLTEEDSALLWTAAADDPPPPPPGLRLALLVVAAAVTLAASALVAGVLALLRHYAVFAAALVLTIAPIASAQFVTPRDFPSVDFGRLEPGDPVPGQPGATFRHTGLGWAITPAPIARVAPPLAPAPAAFLKVGHAYVHQASGARLFIAGTGQLPGGSPVLFAVCLRVAPSCAGPGTPWMLTSPDARDFVETSEVW